MSQRDDDLVEAVRRSLRQFWAGRSAVLLTDRFDRATAGLIAELTDSGATVAAVVSRDHPDPGTPAVPHLWCCADEGLDLDRAGFERLLADPPDALRDWLDARDPDRAWLALGTPRTGLPTFCGRPVHGWRRPEWAALEDKTVIDALWARTGVPAPRHVIARPRDLTALAPDVDGGFGVVVAGDASQGFLGDARGLRWARTPAELEAARRWFAERSARVRVAEFVPGAPCSVLGMVLPDGVAVFDPIEIVTLHDPATGALLFCGSSTHWRPPGADREAMRECARRAGADLTAAVGYRGVYSVDGVLGPGGFVATELNPRHASGLGLGAGLPELPFYLFNRGVQEGLAAAPCDQVEAVVRAAVRGRPSMSVRLPAALPGTSRAVLDRTVRYDGDRVLAVEPALPGGIVAPAVAALARLLGPVGWASFPAA